MSTMTHYRPVMLDAGRIIPQGDIVAARRVRAGSFDGRYPGISTEAKVLRVLQPVAGWGDAYALAEVQETIDGVQTDSFAALVYDRALEG